MMFAKAIRPEFSAAQLYLFECINELLRTVSSLTGNLRWRNDLDGKRIVEYQRAKPNIDAERCYDPEY